MMVLIILYYQPLARDRKAQWEIRTNNFLGVVIDRKATRKSISQKTRER